MRNILFFGDSLTAGYGLADVHSESFPALIQQKINTAGLAYHVINGGLSGDTSAGGLNRLEYWLNRPVDVFVLELGVNDMIRRVPAVKTYQNLDAIIVKVKAKHPQVKIALMGMELPAFFPGLTSLESRSIFRKLADAHKIILVPFFLEGVAGQPHLNLRDGLHPSAAGYRIIADKVWPVISPMLTAEEM